MQARTNTAEAGATGANGHDVVDAPQERGRARTRHVELSAGTIEYLDTGGEGQRWAPTPTSRCARSRG